MASLEVEGWDGQQADLDDVARGTRIGKHKQAVALWGHGFLGRRTVRHF